MSNRNNKVIIIFSIMLIAMNLFALTQTLATNNQFDGTMKTALPGNTSNEAILPLEPTSNGGSIPNLDAWDLTINVSRVIRIYDYGYLTVNDSYTIINNDNVTLPIFRFAIENELVGQLARIAASTMWLNSNHKRNNTQVSVEYKDDYFTYYVLNLNPVVNNNSKYSIIVHQTYIRPYKVFRVVDDESWLRNGMHMNLTGVPLLTQQIRHCQTSFIKTSDGAFINDEIRPTDASIGEGSVMYTPYTFVKAYNFSEPMDYNSYKNRIIIASWMSLQAPSEATSYKRTIYIDNWYYAKIEEEITIKSYGIRTIENQYDLTDARTYATFALLDLHLYIDNAENVKVYDQLGTLPPRDTQAELVQLNRINIYLRVPLFGGDTASFKVSYTLKLEDVLQFNKSEFILNTLGVPQCEFHVPNYELNVVLPQGASFQYISFGEKDLEYTKSKTPIFLRLGSRESVSFTVTNVTYFDNLNLQVGYFFNDLAYFIQPLTFSLIIFIACLLYVGVRILRKDVLDKVVISPDEKEEIPIQLIQEFVEKYEEKTALQTRISNLDEDRRRKKVKAKEYDQQRKILEAKMRETIKTLDTTKKNLKEKGRKYGDVIQKIEVFEEKRHSVERSIQDLRIRYIREKAISKDAYLRILNDYQSQIEKFERDIDKEIINLRLLIEHEQKEK